MIYLDNAATTKPCQAAVNAVLRGLEVNWGNPSALHRLGLHAEQELKSARRKTACALGCRPEQIFFTSGGTESDNFAVFSIGTRSAKRSSHIITTAVEHHAVLNAVKEMETRGTEITVLQPDAEGVIQPDAVLAALRENTVLVSVMMVNNEIGSINDISAIAKIVHRNSSAVVHTDAVQGFGKIPFRASSLGADLISISAHKIHGPKGCGAVYVNPVLHLPPMIFGGGQERNMRSGTENIPAIMGFGAACEEMAGHMQENLQHMTEIRDYTVAHLPEAVPEAVIIGPHQAPHILMMSVPGLRSQGLIGALEERDIYVSAGSACAKGHRSHVLEAIGTPPEIMDGSIRISFSGETELSDIDTFLRALREAVDQLKKHENSGGLR